MSLAGLLIVLGIIVWLLVNPTIGLVLVIVGVLYLAFGLVGPGHPRRYY